MFKTPEKQAPVPESTPVNALEKKVQELTETLQRVQADFENYRKRSQGEMNVHYLRGKASAFKDMLAFLDTLDSAIAKETNETRKALENIRTHLLHVLTHNGVKPISTVGKIFDPFTSECLLQGQDMSQDEDVVLEELQRGYFFHDDVLRPAKVKVNKRGENENSDENEKQNELKQANHDNQSTNNQSTKNMSTKNTGGTNHE